ncbi:MAG: fucose isomerase [Fibrobacteria bacterium]|nr:fucose isomerase [Fibrobacteria bacterium]
MTENKKKAFGVIVGTRGCFNGELAREGRREILDLLEKEGYQAVILPEDATPTGAVETTEDGLKCAKFFAAHADSIAGIIVTLPNFSNELGVVNAVHMAKLDVPVLVQAFDDEINKVSVRERRDSFCGKISVCNNFNQYGIPYTETTNHTCSLSSDEFKSDLQHFAKVCRVANGLSEARIGAVGARPGDFQTMRYSEKLLQDSGITVVTVDLSEILGAAEKIGDKDATVTRKIEEINAYGRIIDSVPMERVIRQAKFGLSLEAWMQQNRIDAAGVQCWTSIQENYGCASCLSMSMLSNQLIPCACEVDVCGVISMYALTLASEKPSAILDWNNNYGDDRDMCVNTHCSNFPKDFIGKEVEISNLDVLGTVLGPENCFGAIKGKVQAGPMSFFRISTDDYNGGIKAYAGQGNFTDDPFDMNGGIAVCKVPDLRELMRFICKNGFEHHVAMVRGNAADAVSDACEEYLGWDIHRHS